MCDLVGIGCGWRWMVVVRRRRGVTRVGMGGRAVVVWGLVFDWHGACRVGYEGWLGWVWVCGVCE